MYKPNNFENIKARFRHRQPLQNVTIRIEENKIIVSYKSQKNIVPGQYCVLYQDNKCIGGGQIFKVNQKK